MALTAGLLHDKAVVLMDKTIKNLFKNYMKKNVQISFLQNETLMSQMAGVTYKSPIPQFRAQVTMLLMMKYGT